MQELNGNYSPSSGQFLDHPEKFYKVGLTCTGARDRAGAALLGSRLWSLGSKSIVQKPHPCKQRIHLYV